MRVDIGNERDRYVFRHVAAERNIVPEEEEELGGTLEDLSSTGSGASNIIRAFLNNSSYDETIIEDTLLKAVKEIMSPVGGVPQGSGHEQVSFVTYGKRA